MKKSLSIREMNQIAWREVEGSIEKLGHLSDELRENLVWGLRMDNDFGYFEYYIAGKRPEDAIVLLEVKIDRRSGFSTLNFFEK